MKKIASLMLVLSFVLLILPLNASASGGPIGGRFTISNDPGLEEVATAVAYNPDRQEYLAVWYNDRPGNDDIRAQRIAWDGRPLGGRFYVAAGPGADRRYPDVAYDSQSHEYLVVWEHYDQGSSSYWIQGQRVSDTGGLIGGAFNIWNSGVSSHAPAVAYASTANRFLIAWSWDSGGLMHIVGRTYAPGVGLGSMFYIFKDTVGSLHMVPDLAYNRARNEFLVVWQEFTAGTMDIYGARVKMSGGPGVLGAPIAIATGGADKRNPAVAAIPQPAGAGRYMVAWEYYNAAGDVDILGQIMQGDGAFGPAVALAYSAWNETAPALAGSENRGEFLATWTFESTSAPPGMMQVNGRTVSWDGWGVGPIMTVGGGQVFNSAPAAGPNGDFLVAFDDNEVIGVAERGIYARLWGNRVYLPIAYK